MTVLLAILLALTYSSVAPIAQAASAGAGLMQAQKEAEAKGFRFDGNRDEIIAKAKKEGALRALLGFDKPAIAALRDGFRKKYPFINPHFEEHGNPAESQRYLLELQSGRVSMLLEMRIDERIFFSKSVAQSDDRRLVET